MIEVYEAPSGQNRGWPEAGWDPGGTARGEGRPKTHSAGRGSLLKATGDRRAVQWEVHRGCYGSINPETTWTQTRGKGRRTGGRGQALTATCAGTGAWHQHQKWADRHGDKKSTSASGSHPPTAASQEAACLSGWLIWFATKYLFITLPEIRSSQSLAIQYDVLIIFFKTKKAKKLGGVHLVFRSPQVCFWLSEQCCSSPCPLEQASVPFKEKWQSKHIQLVSC